MIFQKFKVLFLIIAIGVLQKGFVFAEKSSVPSIKSTNSSVPPKSPIPIVKSTNSSENITAGNNSTDTIPIIIVEEVILDDDERSTESTEISKLDEFRYVILDDTTGVPCTLSKMGITLSVPYKTENDTIAISNLTVPLNANVTGICEESISVMTLAWRESEMVSETVSDGENSLTMRIVKDGDIFYVQDLVVSVYLDITNFPNASESMIMGNSSTDLRLFAAPLYTGIHICNGTQVVHAAPIEVHLNDVSFIAFNNESDISEREVEHCAINGEEEDDKTNVPVIVASVIGGCLGIGLIILIIHRSTRNMSSWNLIRKSKMHESC